MKTVEVETNTERQSSVVCRQRKHTSYEQSDDFAQKKEEELSGQREIVSSRERAVAPHFFVASTLTTA